MKEHDDELARWLIRHAALRSPAALAERLHEEWLADLAQRRGRLARLWFAAGCCWATIIIARDQNAGLVPAAAATPTPASIRVWLTSMLPAPPSWRRSAAFIMAAALHVIVFYAFMVGLSPRLHGTRLTPFQTVTVPDVPRDPPPPPPPPQVAAPKISPVAPEIPPVAAEDPAFPATASEPKAVPVRPLVDEPIRTAEPRAVKRTSGGPGNGFPVPDDFYPSMSIHLGEAGVATVNVCVNVHGRLTSTPSILESTGVGRLDGAALALAKAGSGHYRPSTDDDRPVDSCYAFRVRFNLKR